MRNAMPVPAVAADAAVGDACPDTAAGVRAAAAAAPAPFPQSKVDKFSVMYIGVRTTLS